MGVCSWQAAGQETQGPVSTSLVDEPQPDVQAVALLNPDFPAVHVFHQGQLVAAIELVSPRNKDRPSSREFYRNRYLGYVVWRQPLAGRRPPPGVGLLPAEAMAGELQCQFPVGLPPHAVSWNVGGPTRMVACSTAGIGCWPWAICCCLALALTTGKSLLIDLEQTYADAARRAYLD